MKRKDMDLTVLYAIESSHHNPRPGYVLNRGTNPGKVKVKVYWRWEGQDEDWLNPDPPLLVEGAKADEYMVTTANVLMPWADYCAARKALQAERLRVQQEAEDANERERQALMARVEALVPLLDGFDGFCDLDDLRYMAKSDRVSDQRYSARHVLLLLEHIATNNERTS